MKINVYFQGEFKAAGETTADGTIAWSGPGAAGVKSIADYYEEDNYHGEALLRRLLERLKGYWQAEEVP
jgi:hypothetical protein